jgi:hypothetical protein
MHWSGNLRNFDSRLFIVNRHSEARQGFRFEHLFLAPGLLPLSALTERPHPRHTQRYVIDDLRPAKIVWRSKSARRDFRLDEESPAHALRAINELSEIDLPSGEDILKQMVPHRCPLAANTRANPWRHDET